MTNKLAILVTITMVLLGCAEMQALLAELGLSAEEGLPVVAPGVVIVTESEISIGHLVKHRYDVSESGSPLSTTYGFPHGPASWENIYSQMPQFPVVTLPGGEWAGLWRDTQTGSVLLTRFGKDHSYETVALPVSHGLLLGACADPGGSIYYLTAEADTDPKVELIKVDQRGALLARSILPHGRDAFDIHLFEGDVANLDYGNGMLGVVIGRTMKKGDDGLNHQGSIAATFRASDLELVRIHGQNSGHSFDNKLIFDGDSFVSADLGDNYPRGIVIHRFLDTRSPGRVVFTYKTQHGEEKHPDRNDQRGRPLRAGRWSNDNKTYTELGGVRQGVRGYAVLFSSEASTNNRRTGGFLNESRNLGFVLVSPTFDSARQEDFIVTSDIGICAGRTPRAQSWSIWETAPFSPCGKSGAPPTMSRHTPWSLTRPVRSVAGRSSIWATASDYSEVMRLFVLTTGLSG